MGFPLQGNWEALMAQHDHAVVLALLSRGFRIHEAREISHDTWSRLFEQHLAGKLSTLELPGLAVRQAMFLAADYRREQNRPAIPWEDAGPLADPASTPEKRLALRQQLQRAQAAAAALPPRAQDVFSTVISNPDVPHAQLAERLGLSLQRLRQSLCEARARLKAALEEAE